MAQFVGGQQIEKPGPLAMLRDALVRIGRLERGPTGWRFDTDNEGGWGYVQFNDCFDLDLLPDPLSVGGMWGAAFEDGSGCGFLIGSTATMLVKGSPVSLESSTSPLLIFVNGVPFQFRDDGSIHGPTGGNVVFDL